MDLIYLDHNASTPVLPAVIEAMLPYWTEKSGNPASSHRAGREARKALEDAREQIAALLDAHADEVLFTSGATEANNLAIFGLAGATPGRIVTSALEHPCVSEPIRRLTECGFTAAHLPVRPQGEVEIPQDFPAADVSLVSVMLANHETGAIQPVAAIASRLEGRAPFHCDAAAAVGKTPVSFAGLGVTALTLSAHKFHGPKGVGALLLRRQAPLKPLLHGGHQQQGKRPGTEPVALVVGMAKALAIAIENLQAHAAKVWSLRRRFVELLRAQAPPVLINGPEEGGVPHTLNLSFPGCSADALLMNLDLAGVACSTGSACSSGSLLPSPVLLAMNVEKAVLQSAMRFSFSPYQEERELTEVCGRIINVVNRLRRCSG